MTMNAAKCICADVVGENPDCALHGGPLRLAITHTFGEPCEDFDPECETCQAWSALSALTTAPKPVVKPVEWEGSDNYADLAVVKELGLTYSIQNGRDGWFVAVTGAGISEYLDGNFSTRDEAKAAAQTNYERLILSALELNTQPSGAWFDGVPPKPWSDEWFIAETKHHDRVVLTALPEKFTYDFKTADDTYIKAENIVRWMQFPDSQFISPSQSAPSEGLEVVGWRFRGNEDEPWQADSAWWSASRLEVVRAKYRFVEPLASADEANARIAERDAEISALKAGHENTLEFWGSTQAHLREANAKIDALEAEVERVTKESAEANADRDRWYESSFGASTRADALEDEREALRKTASEFLEAVEALCDWMNGNDLSADHADQCPEDFECLCRTMEALQSALSQGEEG